MAARHARRLGTVLLFVAGIVGTVLVSGITADVPPIAPLVLSAGALLIVVWRWVEDRSTTYELTEDRLILHRGIVNKSIDEVELYRVKDVRIDFSLINQLADIGTLTITGSDETTRGAADPAPHPPCPRSPRGAAHAGGGGAATARGARIRHGRRADLIPPVLPRRREPKVTGGINL